MFSEVPCKEGLIFVKRSSVSKEEDKDRMGKMVFVESVKMIMQKDKSFRSAMEEEEEEATTRRRGFAVREKSESCREKRVRAVQVGIV